MPLLRAALALAALLIGSCSPRPSALHESDALDVLVESELGLRQPITVTRIGIFRDGGSFGGALRDTNGKELLFALDRRERIGTDSVPNDGPPHPQHAYLGSDYPGTAHSRALQVGSRAESALIAVLRSFVDGILPSSAQQSVLSNDTPLGERLDKASSFGESGPTAAMALMIISQLETQRLSTSEEALADLPQFRQWLAAWAPDSAGLSAASFCLAWSAPLQEFRYPDADTTTLAVQVREPGWVLSPDSSRGLHVAIPGDEPDSEVLMVELTTGRTTRVLYSGTPSDFELAWWLDAGTALVAGGDWDHLAPLLYRLDLADGRLDCFRGPELSPAGGRHAKLEKAVRALWTQRFVPGKYSPGPGALHESETLDVLVESELGLRQPITVTRIVRFRDGGSFGGALRDTNGKELLFALDRRERIGTDSVPNDGPPHPQHAYLGSDYPGTAHSRALQVGSRAESALIAVLRSFVDRILPPSAQESARSEDIPLGERLERASSFGESGPTAAMALIIISQLETQRAAERPALPDTAEP